MADIRKILLSRNEQGQKREERFSLTGEDDGKGNIVLHKHYLYNPNKKTKPIKIPIKDFWGIEDSFTNEVCQAQYLPKEDIKQSKQKLKRLKCYLKKKNTKK